MVNVKSVIFFGKSEKNIWVLNFFEYNHWYRISKTVNQIYSWNSITVETAEHLEQLSQQNTWNSYHSYTYNVKQSNSRTAKHLERYHSKTSKQS